MAMGAGDSNTLNDVMMSKINDYVVLFDRNGTISKVSNSLYLDFPINNKVLISLSFSELCSLMGLRSDESIDVSKVDSDYIFCTKNTYNFELNWIIKKIDQGGEDGWLAIGRYPEYKEILNKYLKLDTMINHMPCNVYWMHKDLTMDGCNQNVLDMLNITRDQYTGSTYEEISEWADWPEGLADSFKGDDEKVITTGQPIINAEELPFEDASGRKIHLLTSRVPLKNSLGDIVGVAGISTDITELKEALKNQEAGNKAKSDFIANMSHDLRTPMTGVLGMLREIVCLAQDILKSPSQAEEYAKNISEFAEVGEDSANQLLDLFNETIETMKLGSGQIEVKENHFSLGEKVQKSMDLLKSTAHDKKLELKKNISPDVPSFLFGAGHNLDRILTNLISNALKFTKEGYVEIGAELVSECSTKIGDEVAIRVCVADTGIGIPKAKHDTIFEHFSRLNPSYEGNYAGNGLGLFAVKQYVDSMKGSISVESEEGKGSKFIIELPFKVSDHSDKEEQVESVRSLPDKAKKSPDKEQVQQVEKPVCEAISTAESTEVVARALVVEDNIAAAMSIKRALKRLGCEVDHAKTGEESVDFAKNNQYDIVFMDIGLPGISGLEATEQIRGFSSTPIIAVTGHVDKAGVCIDAGMQELLAKPATPSSLEAMLNRHVRSKNDDIQKLNDGQTIIDWRCSVKMHDNDEEITREVLDHVYEGLVESEQIIDAAYAQKNTKRLREEIHKVKGGVCYLRLPQLERALGDFHLTLKEHPVVPEHIGKEYQNLKRAIKKFKEAYEKSDYKKNDDQ